ncbi:MAG: hypothetical protein ACI4OG_01020 [Bacilli bacterium]
MNKLYGISEYEFLAIYRDKNPQHEEELKIWSKKMLCALYNYSDQEAETILKLDKEKIISRGENINDYIFSPYLSATQKLDIIENLRKNNKLYTLTFSEINIAYNLSVTVTSILKNKIRRSRTDEVKAKLEIILSEEEDKKREVLEELILMTLTNYDSKRLRCTHYDIYQPSEEDKDNLKKMLKKQP